MDRSDYSAATDAADDGWEAPADDAAVQDPALFSLDERRLHIRAYNLWASLLDGRSMPAMADLDAAQLAEFGGNSVLLSFADGIENPGIAFLGADIRAECGIGGKVESLAQVPGRSLLTRLTDHYLQIIANAAPVGFEAEFTNQRGADIVYRGILMPFSSDGETIDYALGVLSWKEVATGDVHAALESEMRAALDPPHPRRAAGSPWDMPDDGAATAPVQAGGRDGREEDGLADRLASARQQAETAAELQVQARDALHAAIGAARELAEAAEDAAGDLAELLEDAGIKIPPERPLAAVARLVFGATHGEDEIDRIAQALAEGREPGGSSCLANPVVIGPQPLAVDRRGVSGARAESRADPIDAAFDRLKDAPALSPEAIAIGPGAMGILVARREADGRLSIVAALEDRPSSGRTLKRSPRHS